MDLKKRYLIKSMSDKKIIQTYELTTIKTLVDLNQNLTNFSADFRVLPDDKKMEYEIAVVDQTKIDNEKIEFKTITGDIGANVSWDKNQFKNHFIALKSNSPLKVTIEIDLRELPKNNNLVRNEMVQEHNEPDLTQENYENLEAQPTPVKSDSLLNKWWFRIFLVCVVLFAGVVLYRYLYSNKEKKDHADKPTLISENLNVKLQDLPIEANLPVKESLVENVVTVKTDNVVAKTPTQNVESVPEAKMSNKLFSKFRF